MKITRIEAKAQTLWLPNSQYDGLAVAFVNAHAVKDELPAKAITAMQDQITAWRSGEPTAKGYQVNTRYLLGALKTAYGQELVDALSTNYAKPTAKLSDF